MRFCYIKSYLKVNTALGLVLSYAGKKNINAFPFQNVNFTSYALKFIFFQNYFTSFS